MSKHAYDHIDQVLSNTYFGNKKNSDTPVKQERYIPPKRSKLRKVAYAFVFLLIIGVCFYAALRITNGRKIVFTVVDVDGPSAKKNKLFPFSFDRLTGSSKPRIEASEKTDILFDFEDGTGNWEIPAWAFDKPDHVAESLEQNTGIASHGSSSLICMAKFPSGKWAAAHIEVPQYLDLGNYDKISADIFLPAIAPKRLQAQFILTVGETWRFVEMSRTIPLVPGKWNTLSADISLKSRDWKRTVVDMDFKTDIRKLSIRVQSSGRYRYHGPIYFDAVRVSRK